MRKYYVLKPKQRKHSIRWLFNQPKLFVEVKTNIYKHRPQWSKSFEGAVEHINSL